MTFTGHVGAGWRAEPPAGGCRHHAAAPDRGAMRSCLLLCWGRAVLRPPAGANNGAGKQGSYTPWRDGIRWAAVGHSMRMQALSSMWGIQAVKCGHARESCPPHVACSDLCSAGLACLNTACLSFIRAAGRRCGNAQSPAVRWRTAGMLQLPVFSRPGRWSPAGQLFGRWAQPGWLQPCTESWRSPSLTGQPHGMWGLSLCKLAHQLGCALPARCLCLRSAWASARAGGQTRGSMALECP